ncbi:MAG: SbcC/MukB-like Walker B domain-containing protein, partial [Acidimicrobiales bacterium]
DPSVPTVEKLLQDAGLALDLSLKAEDEVKAAESELAQLVDKARSLEDERQALKELMLTQRSRAETLAGQLGNSVELDLGEVERCKSEAEATLGAAKDATKQLLSEEPGLVELTGKIASLSEKIQLANKELIKRTAQLDQTVGGIDKDEQNHKETVGEMDLEDEAQRLTGTSEVLVELVAQTQTVELSEAAYLKQLEAVEATLGSSSFDDLTAVAAATREPDEVERLSKLHGAWLKRTTELATLQAGLAELEIPDEVPDLDALEKKSAAAESERSVLADRLSAAEAHLETVRTCLGELASDDERILAARSEAEHMAHVAEVCSGTNPRRIPLESWVLAAYLREVVKQANLHLLSMSSGRYHLEVGDEVVDRRTTSGLDIEVYDEHTGKRRGARSLSGGETFQASLALALGLADVVSASRSGLHFDCVFVDEGFGSLDPDALELAIDVLDGLRHRGALVGVITHVTALKEVLPVGIDVQVKPDGSGSTLRQLI